MREQQDASKHAARHIKQVRMCVCVCVCVCPRTGMYMQGEGLVAAWKGVTKRMYVCVSSYC